ncbi:HAD family hydrolase [Vannielia litorea]|uniref:Haloacid dehalogenase superfamily, subfamily IA, variant 3 with third motif having DD or ED/haloacid dehalogenase superfamily, subfamily IA, variant 1 with third motif having Dx(3-4)D or Dx(3-4)E n=1 Tax=Vannielia litorea TaxID=1217970 RepID=A0A1N6ENG3_9RHOB|nr:HAD family hydrolase [Vannielia litorea]SIN84491.1 haloacid dehalogenase superfamily, subfamily IA, variant 3 with third motif having DD or ED/haloacid dehalogenase superfamily, subfamily IA, variant 1 with third motif having Dx(3-4)D or Dx(3-4)E [Vannielia litorea]
MNHIELVIFDCDGVLADSEVISARVLVEALAHHGLTVTPEHVYRNFVGQSFPKVADKIRRDFDLDLPPSFEAAYRGRLVEEFAAGLKPTVGVHDMLAQLGCRSCVATSSSPPRVARTLSLLGLTDRFERVFTASEVSAGKPAPDIFLHAAECLNAKPETCLVIEDSKAGLMAAQAAGMEVWRYTGGAHFAGFSAAEIDTPPGLPAFDNWSAFYQMAPELRKDT